MQRKFFEVYAKIVDANGSYNTLSGYPKAFDSHNYNDDVDKALRRAKAEFHETAGAMLKRDDRQQQTAILMSSDGFIIESFTDGAVTDLPDPEQEPEAEQTEPEGE